MNYEESIEYIHSVNWVFCKPGLERIRELCKRLGDPQDSLRFIHVAGTNGKGSFCSMLNSILTSAGVKTGLFTSPYISFFNERMCIGTEPISNEELAEITSYVRPIADSMIDKPTEFELITAIAFEFFKRNGTEIVILEAGMGGRLDSTNIIKTPLLSVITGIALDHTAFLGDTTEKIAAEKAGIIKQGIPVLFGGEDADAERVISNKAAEMHAEYHKTDYPSLKIKNTTLERTLFDYKDREDLTIRLLGMYQPRNAANVLSAVDILKSRGIDISENAIRAGLESAVWHARFELLSTDPVIIYDGAHNPEGIEMFIKSIRQYFGEQKVIITSTVMGDKDHASMVRDICTVCECAYVFKVNDRALGTHEYAEEYRENGVTAYECADMKEALTQAVANARARAIPLVCAGSLYMYADVVKTLSEIM